MPAQIGRVPSEIGREEKLKLKRAVLTHFADWPKAIPVLSYLFDRSIAGQAGYVSWADLTAIKGAPDNESAIKNLVTRLRKSLKTFFSLVPNGRQQRWKVDFPNRGYALLFSKNDPPVLKSASTEFVDGLWSPYVLSKTPIRLLYSEALLTPAASDGSTLGQGKGLGQEHPERHSAYVATGVMQALLHLLEHFGHKRIPVGHASLRLMDTMSEPDQDLIILASSGTASRTLTRLGAALPLRLFHSQSLPMNPQREQEPTLDAERDVCSVKAVYWSGRGGQVGWGK